MGVCSWMGRRVALGSHSFAVGPRSPRVRRISVYGCRVVLVPLLRPGLFDAAVRHSLAAMSAGHPTAGTRGKYGRFSGGTTDAPDDDKWNRKVSSNNCSSVQNAREDLPE